MALHPLIWLISIVLYNLLLFRAEFGPDLQFVVLDMDLEQQVERVRGRHGDNQEAIQKMKVRP